MADSDEEVAAMVAAWEKEHGLEPRDWSKVGLGERAEEIYREELEREVARDDGPFSTEPVKARARRG